MDGRVFIRLEKAVSHSWNNSYGTNNLHFVMSYAWFFLNSMVKAHSFTPTRYFLGLRPSAHTRDRHHHPSVILFLATSAVTISRLPGTKLRILTACYNGLSSRQMGLPPCHLLDAYTLTLLLLLLLPRHCNVICGLPWSCQWNTSALSYLNSSTVPLRVVLG